MGKYINHSKRYINAVPKKVISDDGTSFIGIFALTDIKKGMELRYDYGITGMEWQKVSVDLSVK